MSKMKRLTKDNYVDDCFRLQNEINQLPEYKSNHYTQSQYDVDLWHKVKSIEDIEEELGIDLIILFKALQNGVYYFTNGAQLMKNYVYLVDNYMSIGTRDRLSYSFITSHEGKTLLFKDYGKIWALTREELKNDN